MLKVGDKSESVICGQGEQVRDSVEFVRIVWEEIERSLRDEYRRRLFSEFDRTKEVFLP